MYSECTITKDDQITTYFKNILLTHSLLGNFTKLSLLGSELLWMESSLPKWNGSLNPYGIELIPLIQLHNLLPRAKTSPFFSLRFAFLQITCAWWNYTVNLTGYWDLLQYGCLKIRHHFELQLGPIYGGAVQVPWMVGCWLVDIRIRAGRGLRRSTKSRSLSQIGQSFTMWQKSLSILNWQLAEKKFQIPLQRALAFRNSYTQEFLFMSDFIYSCWSLADIMGIPLWFVLFSFQTCECWV